MSMTEGRIIKALSGFYYVETPEGLVTCRARGKFRLDGTSPLVGDLVEVALNGKGEGTVGQILPRRNRFIRPAVANIELMVMVAAAVNPVTDPYLIDRVWALAAYHDCDFLLCVNKTDLNGAETLRTIYTAAGADVVCTSAETREGVEQLIERTAGKLCAFTGNSGVGKSSLLNRIQPGFALPTAEVSEKLGRGKHTTRHVELFSLGEDTFVADTPGFASFELEMMEPIPKERLQFDFREFQPGIGRCRFPDCSHRKEPDCAVRALTDAGEIPETRYRSYLRLYELSALHKPWE